MAAGVQLLLLGCALALFGYAMASSALGTEGQSQYYLEAEQTGVWHCTMTMHTQKDFPQLKGRTNSSSFRVLVALRYMSKQGSNRVDIQGIVVADVPAPLQDIKLAGRPKKGHHDIPQFDLDPRFELRSVSPSSSGAHQQWPLSAILKFPIGLQRRAMPYNVTASFQIPPGHPHEYVLSALDGGRDKTCQLRPSTFQNRLDARGMEIDRDTSPAQLKMPSEAVVVVKPIYNMRTAVLERHIQHYAMLGFTRYVVYVQPAELDLFLSNPTISKWVQQGFLLVIRWAVLPPHEGLPHWDQRLVYNHAVLAFLGRPTFLFMPDLDEYLVSLRPGVTSVFDMVRECVPAASGGAPVNLQIQRRHVIARNWTERGRGEMPLWLTSESRQTVHPFLLYSHINHVSPPYVKTMANPNFVKMFHIHVAKNKGRYNVTHPDPSCMLLGHMCNLYVARQSDPGHLARFREDPAWVEALRRLGQQRQQWLAAGSTAAAAAAAADGAAAGQAGA